MADTIDLGDQLAKLEGHVKTIADAVAKLSEHKVGEARANARGQYRSLIKSGQHVMADVGGQVNTYEGQLVEAIRQRPFAVVAGAVGIGFLIALLSRR